jgi:hypothetical protein
MSPDDVRDDDARYFADERARREREEQADESDDAEVSL